MYVPRVTSELDALLHRQSPVGCPMILPRWIAVEDARPQKSSSPLWINCKGRLEIGEVCSSPLFHIAQVQEEGEDARSALAIPLMSYSARSGAYITIAWGRRVNGETEKE